MMKSFRNALNRCLNEFKSLYHSTFLLLSRMLNEVNVEAFDRIFSTLLGMRLRSNRSLNDVSMSLSHSNKSVSIVTIVAAAWD